MMESHPVHAIPNIRDSHIFCQIQNFFLLLHCKFHILNISLSFSPQNAWQLSYSKLHKPKM